MKDATSTASCRTRSRVFMPSNTPLIVFAAAALALVTLVRWHVTVPHGSLEVLRYADLCEDSAAGQGRHSGDAKRARTSPWRLRSKTLLCVRRSVLLDDSAASAAEESFTSAKLQSSERVLPVTVSAEAVVVSVDTAGTRSAADRKAATAADSKAATAAKREQGEQVGTARATAGTSDVRAPWLVSPTDSSANAAAAAASDAFACHFFQHLDHLDHSSWELQQPAARGALEILRRLYPRHRCPPPAATPADNPKTHSSASTSGPVTSGSTTEYPADAVATLQPLVAAVAVLQSLACSGGVPHPPPMGDLQTDLTGAHQQQKQQDPALLALGEGSQGGGAEPAMPAGAFVAVRRLTLAVMHQLWLEQRGPIWQDALAQAAPIVLSSFQQAHLCAVALRPNMEMFHVSKSGGTTVCQLARFGTRVANNFLQDANCMQEGFFDEPKWTTVPAFASHMMSDRCSLWPAYKCDDWLATPEVSCAARQKKLLDNGLDFYSNEHALHGSTSNPGSAHTCPQFESIVTLRDPLLRTEAHIVQVITVYVGFSKTCASNGARQDYQLERNLPWWSSFAPAVVDNYVVRSLLGKHGHCRAFGSLTADDLYHAQLKLMTFDHIFVLEDDALNDVVFRLGLGWPETLRFNRLRWKNATDVSWPYWDFGLRTPGSRIEQAGGFPAGSSQQLAAWNALDIQLHAFGKAALLLDAEFFSTAAVYEHRVQKVKAAADVAVPAAAASTDAAQAADAAATAANTAAGGGIAGAATAGAAATAADGAGSPQADGVAGATGDGGELSAAAAISQALDKALAARAKNGKTAASGARALVANHVAVVADHVGGSSRLRGGGGGAAPPRPPHVRTHVANAYVVWDAQVGSFAKHAEQVTAMPLPVTPALLLFHAAEQLPKSEALGSSARTKSEAGGSQGSGDRDAPVAEAFVEYNFLCPDASRNGTRKVQRYGKHQRL